MCARPSRATCRACRRCTRAIPRPRSWRDEASVLLREHREWMRIEWRDADARHRGLRGHALSLAGVRSAWAGPMPRAKSAWPAPTPAGSAGRPTRSSYFVPQSDGLGVEVMELCLPQVTAGQLTGYVVATYSLAEILAGMIGPQLTRSQEVSFTEADGTRLARAWIGASRQPGVHVAAAGRPARQHHGAAHGQLARRARPVPQRADGAGHGHVDRAGAGAAAARARRAQAPARRGRPRRRAGVSQGDGGFAGHRPARARPAGPHHLRQSRFLRDGGLPGR